MCADPVPARNKLQAGSSSDKPAFSPRYEHWARKSWHHRSYRQPPHRLCRRLPSRRKSAGNLAVFVKISGPWNVATVSGEVQVEKSLRSPRFVASALLAVILSTGLAAFGWLWGIPRWNVAFDGALAPGISAYGGWAVSIGFVALGSSVVAGCIVASWIRRTYHYLMLGAAAVAVLTFIALGLPAAVLAQIRDGIRLVVVGLCGLMVLAIFGSALKARLTRRFRT